MVTINPLRGGIGGLPPLPTRKNPSGTELSRAVVLERDSNRRERKRQQDGSDHTGSGHNRSGHNRSGHNGSDSSGSDQPKQQSSDYPAYNPHSGLTPEVNPNPPLDVVA